VGDKQAVVFGAGNVGRGFLAQLFSESGYEVIFVDVDEPLVAALDARRAYTIQLVDNEGSTEVEVSPVRALLSQDDEAVARALAGAHVAATAVGVRALPHVAPLVAAGVARRAEEGEAGPLNVIVCENLKEAGAAFRRMVAERVPSRHAAYLERNVGFVDTVIGRMVPPPTPEMRARDPSLIAVEPYKELPVDRRGFVGPVPAIVGLEACDNFPAYTARKLYVHNCGHATLGYLGYLRGHEYGYQALADEGIRAVFDKAMEESRAGIVAAHGVEPGWLEAHVADLVRRFANRALGDTVFRLARDPPRKLRPQDRLVGAARLAEEAGARPEALAQGIAAAYRFDAPEDPLAVQLQERLAAEGLSLVMADVSGIRADEPLGRLVQRHCEELRAGR
jgi:mannitol-1-phosphate 5-dehydrogenase